MAWFEYHIKFEESKKEIVNAFLISADVDAILDQEDHFVCYKSNPEDPEVFKTTLSHLPGVEGEITYQICEEKNWNADWEANYDPIGIENICYIRAEFHQSNPDFPFEIIIRPQMAFGTGHHETTYMMIQMMNEVDFTGKEILDYGCGTGILSIFAAMLKCQSVKGIDIEGPAIENSILHQSINSFENFSMDFELGGLEILSDDRYDIILANINRGVLLKTKEGICNHLKPKAKLLMSGILKSDESLILEKYGDTFDLLQRKEKGEWLCFLFQAKN